MTHIPPILVRIAVTLGTVALALIVGSALWDYYMNAPWTRDGRVRADVVAVAPDVSGLVTEILVNDNQEVKRGDVLFRVDPERFQIALRQAEAIVDGKKAAAEQLSADYQRYAHLSEVAASQQKVEAARSAQLQAAADLRRAVADRDLAKLNLERSAVKAQVNGLITNMNLRPGAYVTAGRGVLALIDSDTLRVEGYFEETKLRRIHLGDPVTIHLMGEDQRIDRMGGRRGGWNRRQGKIKRLEPARQRQSNFLLGAVGATHSSADKTGSRAGRFSADHWPYSNGLR